MPTYSELRAAYGQEIECPVADCDHVHMAWGMANHIRQTDDIHHTAVERRMGNAFEPRLDQFWSDLQQRVSLYQQFS